MKAKPSAKTATLDEQIRGTIEDNIRSGVWKPGDKIASEIDLAAEYGCARATVSKALSTLHRAGLIERRRKAGSFVAFPHVQSAALDIPDIASMIMARGEQYHFELKTQSIRSHRDDDPLNCKGDVLILEGIHHAGGRPFGYEVRHINLNAVPDARIADFGETAPGSWLLEHISWTDARHRICAVQAGGTIAKLLDIASSDACLQLERSTWRQGQGVTWVRQTFPGDRYDLVAEFTPQS